MTDLFTTGVGPWVVLVLAAGLLYLLIRPLMKREEPRSRYVEALNALLEGDEERAFEELKLTVQVDKANVDAYLRLGNLLRRRGAIERALRIHRDLDVGTFFRRKITPEEKVQIREAIADDLLAARRADEALAVLGDLLKVDKTNQRIRRKMVAIHERQSQWNRAFTLYREGFRVRKEKAPERVARYRAFSGNAMLQEGDRDRAIAAFNEALQIDPAAPEALYRLGELHFEDSNLEEVTGFWERFHRASPGLAFLTFERFEQVYFESGHLGRMEKVYETILESSPKELETLLALSSFYSRRGEWEDALVYGRRARNADPLSVRAWSHMLLLMTHDAGDSKVVEEIRHELTGKDPARRELICGTCQYTDGAPFWRCPQCLNWYTAKKIVVRKKEPLDA